MKTLARESSGFFRSMRLETVEYSILAGLVAIGLITLVTTVGVWVSDKFSVIQTALAR